ncbi:hypothetical protein TNCV_3125111 [Trichonephila clavipes]|nr:hypothetical protein TNCV_2452571 [Trichonephila clavipes]GFT75710.1 hypothetical protein TNCV_3125111 [Trichonephila clavipes]
MCSIGDKYGDLEDQGRMVMWGGSHVTSLLCVAQHCLVEKYSFALSGNTCGLRMSWTYHWAAIVPWINIRGDRIRRRRRPGSIPLQSNLVVHDTTPNGGVGGWVSLAAHVKGIAISDVLQSGALRWFEHTQGSVMKVLLVSGQYPMRQLAVRARVVLCDGLLDDWSVDDVLSLVTV